MAASKDLKISIEGLDKVSSALKELASSGKLAAAVMKGLSGAAATMAKSVNEKNFSIGDDVGVVSRGEFKQLAEKYGKCSQRMSLLLSLISPEELKRVGLLPADAAVSDIDGFDRVMILKALDEKVEQFNHAHQRLTGKRKKIADPGRIELTQEEMATVFAAKAAGLSTEKILEAIRDARAGKTIRL